MKLFEELLKQTPDIWYHYTLPKNVDSIIKNGFNTSEVYFTKVLGLEYTSAVCLKMNLQSLNYISVDEWKVIYNSYSIHDRWEKFENETDMLLKLGYDGIVRNLGNKYKDILIVYNIEKLNKLPIEIEKTSIMESVI